MRFIRTLYNLLHNFLFRLIVALKSPVQTGHISVEHLLDKKLDDKLVLDLDQAGITVKEITINPSDYQQYLENTKYPVSYYGGGKDPRQNFIEKTLEHFVSFQFLNLKATSNFIDIAACTSPFYTIVKEKYNLTNSYQQDLVFKKGLHRDKIGGYASEIPLPDQSIDAVTLHCSLEHFEGNSDTEFFVEMQRVLKPGGKVIVLPFYLAYEYTIHLDPAFNLLKFHMPKTDKSAAIRYCNWKQYYSRHYDVKVLQTRILNELTKLELEVFRLQNFKDIHPTSYLRFIGVFTKNE
ncbi:MAG: class I SAM-dependent methyltransferase [Bacteroidetes bacterium]|nr:class I SAM-dependent methyltransferase [Bacteroidota bacterium]